MNAAKALIVQHATSAAAIGSIFQNKALTIRGNNGFAVNKLLFAHT